MLRKLDKKGFTLFEAILAMGVVGSLLMLGTSLVSFASQTTFIEMKAAVSRSNMSENILYMSREFQSANTIYISDDGTGIYAQIGDDLSDFYASYIIDGNELKYYGDRNVQDVDRDGVVEDSEKYYSIGDSSNETIYVCPTRIYHDLDGDGVVSEEEKNINKSRFQTLTKLKHGSEFTRYGEEYTKSEYEAMNDVELLAHYNLRGLAKIYDVDVTDLPFDALERQYMVDNLTKYYSIQADLIMEKHAKYPSGNPIKITLSSRRNVPVLLCRTNP